MPRETIPAQWLESVQTYRKPDAFQIPANGHYQTMSHEEAHKRVYHAALGLGALHLAHGDRVALLSENRVEWALADLAILSCGCINVPVYATLPAHQVEYVLRNSEARAVFVSSAEQLEKIREIRANLPVLQHVILFDEAAATGGELTLPALEERGRLVDNPPDYETLISTVGPTDWASIIYTSGTTGAPKGVILTHRNFMSNVSACLEVLPVLDTDVCLSFLPLSHVLERTAGYYIMMTAGASIAYAESIEAVPQNFLQVRPTVMISVPRLYEKMYARILDTVEQGSGLKQSLFRWAVGVGQRYVSESLSGNVGTTTRGKRNVANTLVFKKLKRKTGGRLRYFVSGGAPLARDIAEFFFAAGLPILEGYGLTETTPVLAVNTLDRVKFGTVGRAIPGVKLRIAPDGEILAQGPNVMQGYYKNPEATANAIVDGWFHTGDIGFLDEDGFLTITDRKKDIIVTAGGKNIAPQPIEGKLKQSPYITEAILVGDKRPYIAALIVPTFDKLEQFAVASHIPHANMRELIDSPRVRQLYQEELDRVCSELASYETPHKFHLLERELTVDDGELTPSLKVKRRVVEEKFKAIIDATYAE